MCVSGSYPQHSDHQCKQGNLSTISVIKVTAVSCVCVCEEGALFLVYSLFQFLVFGATKVILFVLGELLKVPMQRGYQPDHSYLYIYIMNLGPSRCPSEGSLTIEPYNTIFFHQKVLKTI